MKMEKQQLPKIDFFIPYKSYKKYKMLLRHLPAELLIKIFSIVFDVSETTFKKELIKLNNKNIEKDPKYTDLIKIEDDIMKSKLLKTPGPYFSERDFYPENVLYPSYCEFNEWNSCDYELEIKLLKNSRDLRYETFVSQVPKKEKFEIKRVECLPHDESVNLVSQLQKDRNTKYDTTDQEDFLWGWNFYVKRYRELDEAYTYQYTKTNSNLSYENFTGYHY
jgi:hypothetical protein